MNTTNILGEAVGVQYQEIQDHSETDVGSILTSALIIGRFKRGEVGRAMNIHQGNIRGMLGYDPKNLDYIAVQDCLDAGIPSVRVLRVAEAAIGFEIGCAEATNAIGFLGSSVDIVTVKHSLKLVCGEITLEHEYEPSAWDSYLEFIKTHFNAYLFVPKIYHYSSLWLQDAVDKPTRLTMTFDNTVDMSNIQINGEWDEELNPTVNINGHQLTACLMQQSDYVYIVGDTVIENAPSASGACSLYHQTEDTSSADTTFVADFSDAHSGLCRVYGGSGQYDGEAKSVFQRILKRNYIPTNLTLRDSTNAQLFAGDADHLTLINSAGQIIYQDED